MVPQGHSYTVIAAEISRLDGPPISRNSAISKAARLGINIQLARSFQMARKKVLAPSSEQMQREAVRAAPDLITPPQERRTLDALTESSCRFPYGEVAPFLFCGKSRVPGKPYCPAHCLRAFDPPQPRRHAVATDVGKTPDGLPASAATGVTVDAVAA